MPQPSAPAPDFRLLALAGLCAVLLGAAAMMFSRLSSQRAALAAEAIRADLAERESRSLRQQLEAERILAAAQSRLLQEAILNPRPRPSPTPPAGPSP